MEKEFLEIMRGSENIALATEMNGETNVRIVTFYYEDGTLYFMSHKNNQKVKELAANDTVAFTTIPSGTMAHARVKGVTASISKVPLANILTKFEDKIPGYTKGKEDALETRIVYEIKFDSAFVIVSPVKMGLYQIQ